MVIQGRGFFQVRRPSGELAYTRVRLLSSRPRRQHGDRRRQPARAADHHSRRRAGRSPSRRTAPSATRSRTRQPRSRPGQIQLANFPNPAGLNSLGGNLYTPTDASGDPTVGTPGGQEGLGTLMQGYVEQSNVSVVEEFINLIVAQRGYEANSKVVQAADQMYQQVNNLAR